MKLKKTSSGYETEKPDTYTLDVRGFGIHFDEWVRDAAGDIGLFRHGRQIAWVTCEEKKEALDENLPEERRIDRCILEGLKENSGENDD